jgi:ketosteroid isomerase-like protein
MPRDTPSGGTSAAQAAGAGEPTAADHDLLALAQRGLEAFNTRDVDGLLALAREDVELVPFRAALHGQSYRGESGVRRWLADVAEDWDDWRVVDVQFRRSGDRVLTLGRICARSRATGMQVETPAGFVTEYRDGRIQRLVSYSDPAEAMRAAGLEG